MVRAVLRSGLALLMTAVASGEQCGGQDDYALVVDAGSSGSRMNIFCWRPISGPKDQPELRQYIPTDKADEALLEVEPGISSYAADPTGLNPGITQLVTQAARWVPADKAGRTQIVMYATAGMRLLDAGSEDAVWRQVRSLLSDPSVSPFLFESSQAKTITGATEGAYGWLTANYVAGNLQKAAAGGSAAQLGALDLGGASTQITFQPQGEVDADGMAVSFAGHSFELFAQTHMRSGQDQAVLRLLAAIHRETPSDSVESVCHRPGWRGSADISDYGGPTDLSVTGNGNYTACRLLIVRDLLGKVPEYDCLQRPCNINGAYQPALQGNFFAMSGFFYALNGIGLVGWGGVWNDTLAQMMPPALSWCAQNGANDTGYTVGYCFNAAYVYSLLVDGYGFDPTTPGVVTSSRKLNGYSIGWAMGAALHQISELGYAVILENDKQLVAKLAECQADQDQTPGWVWPVVGVLAAGLVASVIALVAAHIRLNRFIRDDRQFVGIHDLSNGKYDRMNNDDYSQDYTRLE